MCNPACIAFGARSLAPADVAGRAVIEVGSREENGSLRPTIEALQPARYVGVDIFGGPGVDEICDAARLVERYGPESFDVVVSTEMLEHVRDWRAVVTNLKTTLKPGGILLATTRSFGYPYHGAPSDFWRYELDDMRKIFKDLSVEILEADPISPGVFLRARKPLQFQPVDLSSIALFSIVTGRRSLSVGDADVLRYGLRSPSRIASKVLPEWAKRPLRRLRRTTD